MLFDACGLDLDLMTLTLKLDPDIMVTYILKLRSIETPKNACYLDVDQMNSVLKICLDVIGK